MNHYLATYIDLIQSIGFISLFAFAVFISREIFLDYKKENCIQAVKIKVDE